MGEVFCEGVGGGCSISECGRHKEGGEISLFHPSVAIKFVGIYFNIHIMDLNSTKWFTHKNLLFYIPNL